MFFTVKNILAFMVMGVLLGSCGKQQDHTLNIVGGVDIKNSDQSEILLSSAGLTNRFLKAEGKTFCSGVIVSESIILTAAHCVDGLELNDLNSMEVVFGNTMRMYPSTKRMVPPKKIKAIFIHQSYENISSRDDLYNKPANDIALILLDKKVNYPFKPVKIVNSTQSIGSYSHIVLAGFGVTGGLTSDDSGVLRAVDVFKTSLKEEAKTIELQGPRLDGKRIEEKNNGGYVYKEATGGSCKGDSGGPAYISKGNKFELLGVTAFGDSQRLAKNPNGPSYCVGYSYITDLRYYGNYIMNAVKTIESRYENHDGRLITTF